MSTPLKFEINSNLVVSKLQNAISNLSDKLSKKEFSSIAGAIKESLSTLDSYFYDL